MYRRGRGRSSAALCYNDSAMSASDVVRNIRTLSAEHNLLPAGETIVVGVSGGPDSACLLHALKALREPLGIALHVATLDHGLRGAESSEDAAFVAALAKSWGLPASVERIDVPVLEAELHLGTEETARQARYTFLARVAAKVGAQRIAVAHNADDQSETVLMHFLRGSGLAGLRGMRPAIPLSTYHLLPDAIDPAPFTLVRPLLTTPRADIEAYCAEHGLAVRFDYSNLDTTHFRNRLRHEVIPYLERVNPNIRTILRHTAEVAAADYEALRAMLEQAWAAVCRRADESAIVFDRAPWRALPLSTQRATIREAAFRLGHSLRDVSFAHVEDAVRVARTGNTGAQATLPGGLLLLVDYGTLVIASPEHEETPPAWPLLWSPGPIRVRAPGTASLPDSAWRFTLAPAEPPIDAIIADSWSAALMIPPGAHLALRTRRPGDRFAPQGMGGHTQKLADFMINAKIPAPWRDHIPLLTVDGEIAWVAGWRVSHHFAVPDEAASFFVARFTTDV